MAKFSKQKRHLRLLAKSRFSTSASAPVSASAKAINRPSENIVYVPVVEDVDLGELPTELQRSKDEWDEIFAEPDSDYDAETDEEDWSTLPRTDKTWVDLQRQMQSAASSVQPSQRYIGNSRATVFRRKKALKKASEGTSSLFSFGFVRSNATCNLVPDEDVDMGDEPGMVEGTRVLGEAIV